MRIRPAFILIVCCLIVLPLSVSLAEYTIWHSPLGMSTTDSRLSIAPAIPSASVRITTTAPGDLQWVDLGLTLPSNVTIDAVVLCYELASSSSFISTIRLSTMTTPAVATVLDDDPTDLTNPGPTCYTSMVNPGMIEGTITLSLRLNFASPNDWIDIGAIGIRVIPDVSGIGENNAGDQPTRLSLRQNQPNPFGVATTISYALAEDGTVGLSVFDVNGRQVRALFEGAQPAGDHDFIWDGRDDQGIAVASGTYYYRVRIGGEIASKGMVRLQ